MHRIRALRRIGMINHVKQVVSWSPNGQEFAYGPVSGAPIFTLAAYLLNNLPANLL
jgi:hypothetical protein